MNENQRKAKNKYREKIEEVRVELYPTDADIKERITERVAAGEAKATYIKRLIREDIYNTKVAPKVEAAGMLRKLGCSDAEICKRLGLSKEEFYMWMEKYPQFRMAVRTFNL